LDLNKEKQQNAELERQRLDAELKFLKSQLRPHFLLNTLNNIYTLSYLKSPLATPMMMKLSESMKYLLYEGDSEYVPLQDEVRFIENYVELNKLRLDKPELIHFIYKGITPQQRIQPMLFLAFVENVFKHSDTEENDAGFVHIEIEVPNSNQIIFTCKNTVRQSKTNLLEKSGIGLQNVRQRLDILFENNYKLCIEELDNVFSVYLIINTAL
jgi:LytS/YehU family sensor histidine kinase